MYFSNFGQIFEFLSANHNCHVNGSEDYLIAAKNIQDFVAQSALAKGGDGLVDFGPFGELHFPYFSMGNIDSLDLFGIDELILFLIYKNKKSAVKQAADLGANLGLHSIVMAKLGWKVNAFEPDPTHIECLRKNMIRNYTKSHVELFEGAVWIDSSFVKVTKVLGNTTGNHISGFKDAYGETEFIDVPSIGINEALAGVSFAKIDVEGAEGALLGALHESFDLDSMVICMEVSTPNRLKVFEFARKQHANIFCQKLGWSPARAHEDLPAGYKEGSVAIARAETIWGW